MLHPRLIVRPSHLCILVLLMLLTLPLRALGQQGTSELRGRVVDPQGAVVPGVTVVARDADSGLFRETVTTSDGTFFLSGIPCRISLPPGWRHDARRVR